MSEEGLWAGVLTGAALDSEGQELSRPVYVQGFFDHRKCPVPYPWLYLLSQVCLKVIFSYTQGQTVK